MAYGLRLTALCAAAAAAASADSSWLSSTLGAFSRLAFGDAADARVVGDGLHLPLRLWPALSPPCFLRESRAPPGAPAPPR